jgi:hypothetical protein
MRATFLTAALVWTGGVLFSVGQAQVMIAGGSTPPTPVMGVATTAGCRTPTAVPVTGAVPVAYAAPVAYVPAVQVVSGGYYNAPNVVYFGGPNSCYSSTYPGGYYRPGCSYYSSSVIYFGRGEACERGYAFRHRR